jgi:hypothetical protein
MAGQPKGMCYVLYEILITPNSSAGQFAFPINNYLVGRRTQFVSIYLNTDISLSPVTTGTAVADYALLQTGSVTFHCTDPRKESPIDAPVGDWFKNMPLLQLHTMWNTNTTVGGASAFAGMGMYVGGVVLDFNNSFINFQGFTAPETNISVLFGVWYI